MSFSGSVFRLSSELPFGGFLRRLVYKKLGFRLGRLSKTLLAPKSPARAKKRQKTVVPELLRNLRKTGDRKWYLQKWWALASKVLYIGGGVDRHRQG